MITATRKGVGSGGSAAARKVTCCETLSQFKIPSDVLQGNPEQGKLFAMANCFTMEGVDVKPNPEYMKTKGSSEPGQSLVEFALVLPILILIVYGIFDLGRAFYGLVTIANASREGARYMTQHITVMDSSVNNSRQLVREQVKAEALGGGIVLADSAIVVDCERAYDSDNRITPNCRHGGQGWVRVSYNFTPLFSAIFPTTIPIGWETKMRIP